MAERPPVPPANRSEKGPGGSDPKSGPKITRDDVKRAEKKTNLGRQGAPGNLAQNTTHRRRQQDR